MHGVLKCKFKVRLNGVMFGGEHVSITRVGLVTRIELSRAVLCDGLRILPTTLDESADHNVEIGYGSLRSERTIGVWRFVDAKLVESTLLDGRATSTEFMRETFTFHSHTTAADAFDTEGVMLDDSTAAPIPKAPKSQAE